MATHVNFLCVAIAALLFWMAAEVPAIAQTTSNFEAQISAGQRALADKSFERALSLGDTAIRIAPERWDGYALAGLALLNLKQYEPAADALSKAIERAPDAQQSRLRDLRRQCLVAESTAPAYAPAKPVVPSQAGSAAPLSPVVAGRASGLDLRGSYDPSLWVDPSTDLTWARPWYYPAPDKGWPWNLREAQSFCSTMSLGGYSDWRLPTADELQHVFHASRRSLLWSSPTFDPGYGIDHALADKQWRLGEFVMAGKRYPGTQLLLWTSTSADKAGEHVGLYFGQRYNVQDESRMGSILEGSALPTPFQGYALCVRSEHAG
jgi:tetratricopeptide (TPR) repeat protein